MKVIKYGSDFLTSYGSDSGSGSTSQKVTIPTVSVPVPQRCLQEVEVELEAEDAVLRHLVVGEGFLELVDALEEVLAYLGHRLDLQLLDDVLDVGAALGVAEALLVEKGDLVVENVQLFQKLILRDRNLKKSLFYYAFL